MGGYLLFITYCQDRESPPFPPVVLCGGLNCSNTVLNSLLPCLFYCWFCFFSCIHYFISDHIIRSVPIICLVSKPIHKVICWRFHFLICITCVLTNPLRDTLNCEKASFSRSNLCSWFSFAEADNALNVSKLLPSVTTKKASIATGSPVNSFKFYCKIKGFGAFEITFYGTRWNHIAWIP